LILFVAALTGLLAFTAFEIAGRREGIAFASGDNPATGET